MAIEKREGAFLTIGELAQKLDLPAHVLRFWETRFSELDPVKRAGGRRYYRPKDVALATALRHLLYGQGYTIKGVQRLLRERGANAVIESARAGGLPLPAPEAIGVEDEPPPIPERIEPSFEPALSGSAGLPAVVAPVEHFEAGLGEDEIRALRLALADLAEARRLLMLAKG